MKSNLVKTFLVLNLLLCAAVVGVSIKMFMDREVIKARTVIHRQNINEVAENLKWGQELPWEDAANQKTSPFQLPNPQRLNEFSSFTAQLEELSSLAELRLNQLGDQYQELTKTQGELEETRNTLSQRVSELADTRSQVANLESSLADSKQALRENRSQITSLDRENKTLQQQVESLDKQITNQQTLISKVSSELELRTGERDRVRDLLEACRSPKNSDGSVDEWHEKTAQILAVEPEWNYVVINRGEVDVLPMFLEAFVHRGDEFIGKIRVMQVDRTVALAEIINDTVTPGVTLQAGDTIFF